jgi:hypothetical protein
MGDCQEKIHGCSNLNVPTWDLEFHVCTYVSNLAIGAMLAQNPIM